LFGDIQKAHNPEWLALYYLFIGSFDHIVSCLAGWTVTFYWLPFRVIPTDLPYHIVCFVMPNIAIVSSRNSALPHRPVRVKHFLFIVWVIFLYSTTRISQVPKHFLL